MTKTSIVELIAESQSAKAVSAVKNFLAKKVIQAISEQKNSVARQVYGSLGENFGGSDETPQFMNPSDNAYSSFFQGALQKFGVTGPQDFTDPATKQQFFDYVDHNWRAQDSVQQPLQANGGTTTDLGTGAQLPAPATQPMVAVQGSPQGGTNSPSVAAMSGTSGPAIDQTPPIGQSGSDPQLNTQQSIAATGQNPMQSQDPANQLGQNPMGQNPAGGGEACGWCGSVGGQDPDLNIGATDDVCPTCGNSVNPGQDSDEMGQGAMGDDQDPMGQDDPMGDDGQDPMGQDDPMGDDGQDPMAGDDQQQQQGDSDDPFDDDDAYTVDQSDFLPSDGDDQSSEFDTDDDEGGDQDGFGNDAEDDDDDQSFGGSDDDGSDDDDGSGLQVVDDGDDDQEDPDLEIGDDDGYDDGSDDDSDEDDSDDDGSDDDDDDDDYAEDDDGAPVVKKKNPFSEGLKPTSYSRKERKPASKKAVRADAKKQVRMTEDFGLGEDNADDELFIAEKFDMFQQAKDKLKTQGLHPDVHKSKMQAINGGMKQVMYVQKQLDQIRSYRDAMLSQLRKERGVIKSDQTKDPEQIQAAMTALAQMAVQNRQYFKNQAKTTKAIFTGKIGQVQDDDDDSGDFGGDDGSQDDGSDQMPSKSSKGGFPPKKKKPSFGGGSQDDDDSGDDEDNLGEAEDFRQAKKMLTFGELQKQRNFGQARPHPIPQPQQLKGK